MEDAADNVNKVCFSKFEMFITFSYIYTHTFFLNDRHKKYETT